MDYSEIDLRSPEILFNTYLNDFPTLSISWSQTDKEWTKNNLDYFHQLATERNVSYFPNPAKYATGYLVDLCWEEIDERGSKYRWLELALEQEWSSAWEEIFRDFSKLVDIKAKIKVFICFPKESERGELSKHLAHWVSMGEMKHPDESYLVIVFSRDARRKESERLQIEGFEIDYRGRLSELGLKQFPD